jgi:hypothetical protein
LEVDNAHRIAGLATILARVSVAYELLVVDVEKRTGELAANFAAGGRSNLSITPQYLTALYRLRMACSAAAQKARILADRGHPAEAARFLHGEAERLRVFLQNVGRSFFGGKSLVYDDLLHWTWGARGITAARIGRWATAFDPETDGLEGVLQRLQEFAQARAPVDAPARAVQTFADVIHDQSQKHATEVAWEQRIRLTAIDDRVRWTDNAQRNLPIFCDLIDGALEDLDRIDGHAAEYEEMARLGLRVTAYAERFRVEDVPDDTRLVVFVDEEEDDVVDSPSEPTKARVR